MQNKIQWYVTAYQFEKLKWKRLAIPSTGEDKQPMEFLYISNGNSNCVIILKTSFPMSIKWKYTYHEILLSDILSRKIITYDYTITCTYLYIIVHKSHWKQSLYLSSGEGMNCLWYLQSMKYNTSLKKNTQLIHVSKWMKLRNHYGEWVKARTTMYVLYDSIYIKR